MDQAAPKTKGNWGQGLIPLYTRNPACPLLLGVPQTVSLLGTRTPSLFVSVLPLPTPSDPFLPLASSLYGIHRVSYHHFSVREHSLSFLSSRRRPFLPVSKESNAPRATRGSVILLIKQSNTGTVNPYRSPIPPGSNLQLPPSLWSNSINFFRKFPTRSFDRGERMRRISWHRNRNYKRRKNIARGTDVRGIHPSKSWAIMSRGNNPFGMETARNEREREGGGTNDGTKGRKAREKVKTREREILPSQNYNTKCHNYLPNHTLF